MTNQINQHEAARRLLKELMYLYEAIGKAEDKVENLRDYANDLAESLKEFMDGTGIVYANALDSVLNLAKGENYRAMVGIFGFTDNEIERDKKRNEALERHQKKQATKWAEYFKECEAKGVSPYIENKPNIPQPGDWTTSDVWEPSE